MRPLEKEYKAYGYFFTEVKREGMIAIYEQRNDETNRVVAYEVFVIQQFPAGFAGPKKYPVEAREGVPGKEQWGRLGWTYHPLEEAETKFKMLVNRVAERLEVVKE